MILGIDSAQWATSRVLGGAATGPALKYDITRSLGGFGYILIAAGRDGSPFGSYWANFSGVVLEKAYGPRQVMRCSFSFQFPTTGSITVAEVILGSWFSGGVCVCTVSVTNGGFVRLRQGGDGVSALGTLLYQSQQQLGPGVWYSIEVDPLFTSGLSVGWADLYIDDVLDTSGGHSASGVTWGVLPSSFAWVLVEPGSGGSAYYLCDLVVSDNLGATNTGRLGPVRVEMSTFATTNVSQWPTVFPATYTPVHAVSDSPLSTPGDSPDCLASYISTAAGNSETLFSGSNNTCYAKVLGVALSACIIDVSNGNTDLIVRPTPSAGAIDDFMLGTIYPPSSFGIANDPSVLQAISESNPDTGGGWIDGSITNAWWGVKCVTGTPLVTQLVLEKVTTRRNVPFTCGTQGSYAIQR